MRSTEHTITGLLVWNMFLHHGSACRGTVEAADCQIKLLPMHGLPSPEQNGFSV